MMEKSASETIAQMANSIDIRQNHLAAQLWDILDILLCTYIEEHGLWTHRTMLNSAPTQKKIHILQSKMHDCSAELEDFVEFSKTARFGLLKKEYLERYCSIACKIAVFLGGYETKVQLRTPIEGLKGFRADRNKTLVETQQGDKSIFLRHAMVSQQDVDVIILTNRLNAQPGGFIVHQMNDCFGYQAWGWLGCSLGWPWVKPGSALVRPWFGTGSALGRHWFGPFS